MMRRPLSMVMKFSPLAATRIPHWRSSNLPA